MRWSVAARRLLAQSVLLPGAAWLLAPARRHRATIFMLHRFADPERGVEGVDASQLRGTLVQLRKRRYELVGLGELFDRLAERGRPLRGEVAFTIDDGYLEHATVAAPVFAELDCPVTTFLCTGFLDRKLWFWWDQIDHALRETRHSSVEVRVGDEQARYRWANAREREHVWLRFGTTCMQLAPDEMSVAIARLAESLEVELPDDAPDRYAPMSWEDVRACEQAGMSFGAHTVTHPILSRTSDEEARHEIAESWRRVQAETRGPLPIFCYPNGRVGDFGRREIDALRELTLAGAVVAEPGHADAASFRADPDARFAVPRFALPETLPQVLRHAAGLDRLVELVRAR